MDINEKLSNMESTINFKAQNQAVEQQVEVNDKIPESDENVSNSKQGMSEGQAIALLKTIKNPENALGLHLAQSITNKVKDGAGKERLDKTAEKVIESGLTTFETDADNKMNKSQKSAEQVYYESKSVQLNRGGIKKQTTQRIMSRVVKTDDIWSDINFFLFTWWVIGINNYFSNMKEFHWFFKCIINLLFTIPIICLIPFEFIVGVIACIIHFVVFGIKKIILLFKNISNKINKKKLENVEITGKDDRNEEIENAEPNYTLFDDTIDN